MRFLLNIQVKMSSAQLDIYTSQETSGEVRVGDKNVESASRSELKPHDEMKS